MSIIDGKQRCCGRRRVDGDDSQEMTMRRRRREDSGIYMDALGEITIHHDHHAGLFILL